MKIFIALFLGFAFFHTPAFANGAEIYKGCYKVLTPQLPGDEYFCVDVDTLANIWLHYGDKGKPLPPDWEPVKNEKAILAFFTNIKFLLLSLEANATVGNNLLGIYSGNGDVLELRRNGNGQSDLAIKEKNAVSRFVLAPPIPIPGGNSIASPLNLR